MTEPPKITPPTKIAALRRGAAGRCPHCDTGRIFSAWYTVRETCPACGLVFEPEGGGTFVFSYIGSAGVTGLMVLLLFVIIRPESFAVQTALFLGMLGVLFGTLPNRKGVILALDYLIRRDLDGVEMPLTFLGHPEPSNPEVPPTKSG